MNILYEYIFKRKSVRKYATAPLSEELLAQIQEHIAGLKPLYPGIKISIDIVNQIKSPVIVKAPHYLLVSSEDREGSLENVGFMLQQMTLYFTSIGIGSCFLGMGRPTDKQATELPFVITMAFGNPEETLFREKADAKRKSLSEISVGEDPRIEAAQYAPSGINSQNWFFICSEGKIYVYRKKMNPIKALIYDKMNGIDSGIATCNIYMASETFSCSKQIGYPDKKGYIYMCTIE